MKSIPHLEELTLPPEVELCPESEIVDPHRFGHIVLADGRYQLIDPEPLAMNTHADVYRAVDWSHISSSDVALKVYREPNPIIQQHVTRELSAHVALNGMAGIVEARDMGIIEEGLFPHRYLATTLAEGSLSDVVQKGAGDIDLLITMTSQILPSLELIHEQGMVHKDVKPSNILGYNNGSEWVLADFGAVMATPEKLEDMTDEEELSIWQEEKIPSVVGTLGYIAPELVKDPYDISSKVDVFALGVTLFNLSTGGQMPYRTKDRYSYLYSVTKESPVDLISVNNSVPAELGHLTMDCLEHDPNNRPTTSELAEALATI